MMRNRLFSDSATPVTPSLTEDCGVVVFLSRVRARHWNYSFLVKRAPAWRKNIPLSAGDWKAWGKARRASTFQDNWDSRPEADRRACSTDQG